jgi:hypothetical protein
VAGALLGALGLLLARALLAAVWLVEHLSLARGARAGGAPWTLWALAPWWWAWHHQRRPTAVAYVIAALGYLALTLLAYAP